LAEKLRFVAPSDKEEVDGQTSGNDCQGNKALRCFVEQWKENQKQHDEKEKHWQQEIHLQQTLICTVSPE